ncbi:hypothetical protein AVEN_270695-1 [Araneus ventricosus]|uniref:Uncharacterized protein n=1 Tax=Araneus ventricosus TaxID=182803 RepID=A0A4Y2FY08_ARAVE|nr:hypothetical protein AVEN_270695-1 [Araneus ventricosus]
MNWRTSPTSMNWRPEAATSIDGGARSYTSTNWRLRLRPLIGSPRLRTSTNWQTSLTSTSWHLPHTSGGDWRLRLLTLAARLLIGSHGLPRLLIGRLRLHVPLIAAASYTSTMRALTRLWWRTSSTSTNWRP